MDFKVKNIFKPTASQEEAQTCVKLIQLAMEQHPSLAHKLLGWLVRAQQQASKGKVAYNEKDGVA